MTKLCYAFLKYENNMKIGWEKYRTVLKCTQMRAREEIVDVLGWNKSGPRAPNLTDLVLLLSEVEDVHNQYFYFWTVDDIVQPKMSPSISFAGT